MKTLFAWTPFFFLWTLFILTYTGGNLQEALISGVVNTGSAAIMGLGIWHLTKKFPWPDRFRFSFYSAHLLVGLGFAVI